MTISAGWNACSSCHGDASFRRNLLVLPGLASGRIYGEPVLPKYNHPYRQVYRSRFNVRKGKLIRLLCTLT